MDREWIEDRRRYLNAVIGIFRPPPQAFLFEPTRDFYTNVEANPQAAVDSLTRHLGLEYGPALTFEKPTPADLPSEHFVISPDGTVLPPHHGTPGRIAGSRITVSSEFRHRPYPMASILAHEMAHFYLDSKGIHLSAAENEYLTDLAAIVLGLGRLMLNGKMSYDHTLTTRRELGYLPFDDLAYAYEATNEFRWVDPDDSLANLTADACAHVRPLIEIRRQVWRRAKGALHRVSIAYAEALGLADCLGREYQRLSENQRLLNERASSLRVRAKDGRTLVDINNFLLQQEFEALSGKQAEILTRLGPRVGSDRSFLADPGLEQSARSELDGVVQTLDLLHNQLRQWTSTQERYVRSVRSDRRGSLLRALLKSMRRQR